MGNDNHSLLKTLEKIRQEKDVDKIAELIMTIISVNGMTMDEVSAMCFYIMKQSLEAKGNAAFIQQHFNLDVKKLGVSGVLDMQQALISAYLEKIQK